MKLFCPNSQLCAFFHADFTHFEVEETVGFAQTCNLYSYFEVENLCFDDQLNTTIIFLVNICGTLCKVLRVHFGNCCHNGNGLIFRQANWYNQNVIHSLVVAMQWAMITHIITLLLMEMNKILMN